MFANLIVNAIEAMAPQGILHVRVSPTHNWADGRAGVRVTIGDTGTGISKEALGRIFEPFYTTKKDTGTGLGLWVSSGIVKKHGGSIRVRSRMNNEKHGTVFSIFLPRE